MPRMRSLLLVMLLCAAPNVGQAQERAFPYALDGADRVIAPAGIASTALGVYLVGQTDPITLAEITALDRQNVNGFDRGATHNWSPTWQDRSDWGRNVVVLSTALLSAAPWALDGQFSNSVTLGTIVLEAAALTAGVTYIAKGLAGRARRLQRASVLLLRAYVVCLRSSLTAVHAVLRHVRALHDVENHVGRQPLAGSLHRIRQDQGRGTLPVRCPRRRSRGSGHRVPGADPPQDRRGPPPEHLGRTRRRAAPPRCGRTLEGPHPSHLLPRS